MTRKRGGEAPWVGRKRAGSAARDCLCLSLFAFGIQFQWAALSSVVIPADLLRFASEADKARVLGLLASAGALVAVTGQPLFGAWSDRWRTQLGRRPFLLIGAAIGAAAILGLAAAPGLVAFAAAFFLSDVALNMSVAAYHGLWRDLAPAGQEGLLSGYVGLMTVLGNLLGLATSGVTVGSGRTGLAYVSVAGVLLTTALATAWLVRETPAGGPARPAPDRHTWHRLWRYPLDYPDFMFVLVHRILLMVGFNLVTVFLEYFLKDALQLRNYAGATSLLGALVMLGAMASSVKAGSLSDRLGRKGLVVWAGAGMGVAVLGLAAVRSFPVVLALGLVFGLAYGVFTAVDLALGLDVLPSGFTAARDIGVWNVAYHAGRVVAPLIGWQILDRIDPGGSGGYPVLFLAASAILWAGSLVVLRVRGVR